MNQFFKKYVIYVDDDDDDRFLLQRVFEQYSRECVLKSLPNGEELFAALDKATILPDLILLDLNLPSMDGFEILRTIRQQPRYNTIPVVILTTSYQPQDRQTSIELEANGFITKPSTLMHLNQVVLELRQTWLVEKQPITKTST